MGADRIVSGPMSASGTNAQDQKALVFDRQNNILETSGDSHVLAACQTAMQVLNAQTALATVTTAQNLMSRALNAGVLNKIGRTLRITARGIYTTPGTTTPVMTIALVLGGTTVASIATAALSSTASTNMPFLLEFDMSTVSTGAAGTLETHGWLQANISANTPGAASACYTDTNVAVSSAINLNTALTLQLQVSANLTITSIQLRQGLIEVIN